MRQIYPARHSQDFCHDSYELLVKATYAEHSLAIPVPPPKTILLCLYFGSWTKIKRQKDAMEIHMCKYEDTTAQVNLTMELLSTQWSQYSKWQEKNTEPKTHSCTCCWSPDF